jgi:hypothetical protein
MSANETPISALPPVFKHTNFGMYADLTFYIDAGKEICRSPKSTLNIKVQLGQGTPSELVTTMQPQFMRTVISQRQSHTLNLHCFIQ